MNILIPHQWLLEHLETQASPEEIQKYVSLCGPSIERIYEREGDQVYDIEVTTNRVDSMSVRGIAREAAVILPQFGLKAKLKPLSLTKPTQASQAPALPLPIIHNDPQFCHRIMCVALSDVTSAPTPDWMAKRLRQIDSNVHHSLIDITNYVTHDLGHPCHAFDYDQIMKLGGEIIVKLATAGKKFVTLDGEEHTTVGGEVVFENPAGEIIDLPAIKGTANTSITDTTKNILFWLEAIDHQKVRFASMTHAIRTVAAQLNEKQVDPYLADSVLDEGVKYYQDICQAQVSSQIYDDFPGKSQPPTISITQSKISEYLGLELELTRIEEILETLECRVVVNRKTKVFQVTPPTFRPDLEIPADIIEEIARIYGYHNLPSVIMQTEIPLSKPTGVDFAAENAIKHFMANIGWQELYTYSLVSQDVAIQSGFNLIDHLKLANPLTDDKVYLRRSLIPSLAEVIHQNPQTATTSVFEIANVYQPQPDQAPDEILHISFVSTKEFRQVKGDLETLLDHLFVKKYRVIPSQSPQFSQSGDIQAENDQGKLQTIGSLGCLTDKLIGVDIIASQLWRVTNKHPAYQPIPRTASLTEDMTFTLPPKLHLGEVLAAIKAVSPLVYRVSLHDIYQQNYTFSLEYLDPQTNLSNDTIEPVRRQIARMLTETFKAELVGNV